MECLQHRDRFPVEVALRGYFRVRRARSRGAEAVVPCEEMGMSSRGALRCMGPSTHTRIAGIMSGRTISQQGLAVTCKDLPY
jgi:hypothetical protein